MNDLYKLNERYEREIMNLDKWQFFLERDKLSFIQFLRSMEARGISYVQLTKYIAAMKTFLKCYQKPFEHLQRTDLENFLLYMRHLKPSTRKTRWYSIKKFFDYIGRSGCFFQVRFESKNKLPSEAMLCEKEMDALIEHATSLRNRALLCVLCEGGYRIGEILTAQAKDVVFTEYGVKIMVSGKTGMRNPLLIKCTIMMKEHIKSKRKDERLFKISYAATSKMLRTTARRAGIMKKVYPHLLRHSAATRDANHLTESQLCRKYGWTSGSKMCKIYVHLSGRDLDYAILKMHGIEVEQSEEMMMKKRRGIG